MSSSLLRICASFLVVFSVFRNAGFAQKPEPSTVHFFGSAGLATVSHRDVSTSQWPRLGEVSPMRLTGQGESVRAGFTLFRSSRVHYFSVQYLRAGNYAYTNGKTEISQPGNTLNLVRMQWTMHHFKFRDLLPGIDIGIGPQVYLERRNVKRRFEPEIRYRNRTSLVSCSFIVSLRYRVNSEWTLFTTLANGGGFGLLNTRHNIYGNLPRKFQQSWQTNGSVIIGRRLTNRFSLQAEFSRTEQDRGGSGYQEVWVANTFMLRLVVKPGDDW